MGVRGKGTIMKAGVAVPLENTPFPNRDVIQSFSELSRNFLTKKLNCNSLPHNRMVRICYDDGTITSNEICLAIMHTCRSFGAVAVVESEMNYINSDYDDVVILTYNRVIKKDLDIDLVNPIKSIIVKDYESNISIHGKEMEEKIKLYFRNLNFHRLYDGESFHERRNLYPCFFLVN
jgi:hypothetical protein